MHFPPMFARCERSARVERKARNEFKPWSFYRCLRAAQGQHAWHAETPNDSELRNRMYAVDVDVSAMTSHYRI